jgi:hypothetical protein
MSAVLAGAKVTNLLSPSPPLACEVIFGCSAPGVDAQAVVVAQSQRRSVHGVPAAFLQPLRAW